MRAESLACALLAAAFLLSTACFPHNLIAQSREAIGIAGDFQAWADTDGNGRLDPPELDVLVEAAMSLLEGPHAGRTPLDGMFDGNGNGRIDPDEVVNARETWLIPQLLQLVSLNPDAARRVDLNDDGKIDAREARLVIDRLIAGRRMAQRIRSEGTVDPRMDANRDGWITAEEYGAYRMMVMRAVVVMPFQREGRGQEQPRVVDQPTVDQPRAEEAAGTESAPGAVSAERQQPAAATTGIQLTSSISPIFPIFLKYYDDHPIGTAKLKNTGSTAITQIKVQLIVKEYMTDRKLCAGPDSLAPGEEKDVQLYALFTKNVLDISEATKAQANISVEYSSAGETKTKEIVETVNFYNRNNMTWDDDNRIAAFVTANDKSVMMFRSSAVTIVDQASTAVDKNLRTAIALHDALGLYGMKYWSDPKSSYQAFSQSDTQVDYLQFPEQTLQLRTGDCDDLSILESALLEASAVPTAFITIPGHIFIAFQLAMSPSDAKKSFLKPDDLIFRNDAAWVPVEVTRIKDGFLKAWETGAKEWRESDTRGQAAFFRFQDAKAKYAPVGFSSTVSALTLPAESELVKAYTTEVKTFISREIATQVSAVQAEIKKDGGLPQTRNSLGVLYARYGLTTEASAEFERIVKTAEYVPALVNLGNIAFLAGDVKKALGWYERAQKKQPDKATVLLCIARANQELENYGKVKEAYGRLKTVDPTLAAQFTYLDLQGSEATRAADIAGVSETVVWDDK
jgi:hypothetical protein